MKRPGGAGANIRLSFDGGSLGNPGRAYGSFAVRGTGPARELATVKRVQFGRGTNNEAEYWALREGIQWTLAEARRRGLEPSRLGLTVLGDSLLVIRQLQGNWKAKEPRMRDLRDEVLGLLERFRVVRLEHRPRRKSVAEFGH